MKPGRPASSSIALPRLEGADAGMARSQQAYLAVRTLVLSGRLAPGARLPSSRVLAAAFGVARNTVLAAIERLCAEELVTSMRGSGCYVAASSVGLQSGASGEARRAGGRPAGASARGRSAPPVRRVDDRPGPRAFVVGVPALDQFPIDLWARLTRRRWRTAGRSLLGYGPPRGYRPLREAIAAHLRTTRAVRCGWEQVLITSGVRPALTLASRVLTDAGDAVWMENPGYEAAARVFRSEGLRVVPVAVDEYGLNVMRARAQAPDARAAYVTPSHQFPLGVTMSLARRLDLLAWARAGRRWVLEDDYDSEFRYAGPPVSSLQGLDLHDRVIYIGTFSKVLVPAIRLAYLVVPDSLVDAFGRWQMLGDRHAPTVDQAVLTDFFTEGHLVRHLHRMRRLYSGRRDALVAALRGTLKGLVEVVEPEAGLHLVAWLSPGHDDRAAAREAVGLGIDAKPIADYSLRRLPRPGLVLGYGAVDERLIREGVQRLARAVEATHDARA